MSLYCIDTEAKEGSKMAKYTKTQVLQEFKGAFAATLTAYGTDTTAKNELFWNWVDGLVKQGEITQAQWKRWANPF